MNKQRNNKFFRMLHLPVTQGFFILILLVLFASCTKQLVMIDNKLDGVDGDNFIPISSFFEEIISSGVIPNGMYTTTNSLVLDTLGYVGGNVGAKVRAIFVTPMGSGDHSGSDWKNAQHGTNLRTIINDINDATADKIYVVLVGAGVYNPTTGLDRNISFAMKNYTVIIGGFAVDSKGEVGQWDRSLSSVTAFDGDIGIEGDITDNSYSIFNHTPSGATSTEVNNTAVLYGVEIRNGYDDDSSRGAGMQNIQSSPTIVGVTFVNNYAAGKVGYGGGGMYNHHSAPMIKNSSFVSNRALEHGNGGAMFNVDSSPLLINTTFAHNSTKHGLGGAVMEQNSSSVYINLTIVNNTSGSVQGGGVVVYAASQNITRGPVLINSILWNNTIGNGTLNQIHLDNDYENVNITLAGTMLQGGSNLISVKSSRETHHITNHNIIDDNPNLGDLITTYPARHFILPNSSSAIDVGLHVKIDGSFDGNGDATGANLYFSKDGNNWFTRITSDGLADKATPPSNSAYLTKYDATWFERVGRPDVGVYEAR